MKRIFKSMNKYGHEANSLHIIIEFHGQNAEEQKEVEKDLGPDVFVEEYIYRECKIRILQEVVDSGEKRKCPKYFALSSLPAEEEVLGSPIGVGSNRQSTESIEDLKRAAEAYVDKRIRWQEMRRNRKNGKAS